MRRSIGIATGIVTLATSAAAWGQDATTGCDLAKADVEVAGIRLANADSTRRVLGKDYRVVLSDPQSDQPWLVLASRDNKQLLRLRKHAGGSADSYMEVEVKYGRDEHRPQNLKMYEFVTGNGVKLGMRRKALVAKLGPCFKSEVKGRAETLRYELKEKAEKGSFQSPLLKTANMPQYYAEYEFDRDRLVHFRFGHAPI